MWAGASQDRDGAGSVPAPHDDALGVEDRDYASGQFGVKRSGFRRRLGELLEFVDQILTTRVTLHQLGCPT